MVEKEKRLRINKLDSCLFCKIIAGEIPCKKVFESENFLSFYDIHPQAQTHVLVIPKEHYENLPIAVNKMDSKILSFYFKEIAIVADKLGLTKNGFRTIFNTNQHGCQTVFHIHAHILGGEQLSGNMG